MAHQGSIAYDEARSAFSALSSGNLSGAATMGLSAMASGARALTGVRIFVYVLGRGFLGTALCVFVAGSLSQWAGHVLPGVGEQLSLVARWLMAWGDGMVTGMLCAVFVAFKPGWLATWSDQLYLPKP